MLYPQAKTDNAAVPIGSDDGSPSSHYPFVWFNWTSVGTHAMVIAQLPRNFNGRVNTDVLQPLAASALVKWGSR